MEHLRCIPLLDLCLQSRRHEHQDDKLTRKNRLRSSPAMPIPTPCIQFLREMSGYPIQSCGDPGGPMYHKVTTSLDPSRKASNRAGVRHPPICFVVLFLQATTSSSARPCAEGPGRRRSSSAHWLSLPGRHKAGLQATPSRRRPCTIQAQTNSTVKMMSTILAG